MSKLLDYYVEVARRYQKELAKSDVANNIHAYASQDFYVVAPSRDDGEVQARSGAEVFVVLCPSPRKGDSNIVDVRQIEMRYKEDIPELFQRERVELEFTTRVIWTGGEDKRVRREELQHNASFILFDSGVEVTEPSLDRVGETTAWDDVVSTLWMIDDHFQIEGLNYDGWCLSERFRIVRPNSQSYDLPELG